MRRGIALAVAVAGLGWLAASAAGQGSPPVGATPVRTYTVPSETMVPTLPVGSTVDANYAAYDHVRRRSATS
jgi:signal peptidase I